MDYSAYLYKKGKGTINTIGLPGYENATAYTFQIIKIDGDVVSIFLEGNYVGPDGMGEPYHPEQGIVMEKNDAKAVWYGYWEFSTKTDFQKFMEAIKPFIQSVS